MNYWVDPQSNCIYSYKKKAGGISDRRGLSKVTMKTEIGVMCLQVQEGQQPPETEDARTRFSPKATQRSMALPTPGFPPHEIDFGFWPPQL